MFDGKITELEQISQSANEKADMFGVVDASK